MEPPHPDRHRAGHDASDSDGQRRPPTRLEANSAAATIYAVWRSQVIQGAIDARLAPARAARGLTASAP